MTTKPSFHCHRTRTPAVIIFPIVCLVAVASGSSRFLEP